MRFGWLWTSNLVGISKLWSLCRAQIALCVYYAVKDTLSSKVYTATIAGRKVGKNSLE